MRPRAIAQPAGWLVIRRSRDAPFSSGTLSGTRTPIVPRPYCALSPNFSSALVSAVATVSP